MDDCRWGNTERDAGMTNDIICHDVSPGAYPANHFGGFNQWAEVRILEQEVCQNGGSVGSISRWGSFIRTTNNVFTGKTLDSDAVSTYDRVWFNDLAGSKGENGYGWIHGCNAAASVNSDARIALC